VCREPFRNGGAGEPGANHQIVKHGDPWDDGEGAR
jgi:hypothetical protein